MAQVPAIASSDENNVVGNKTSRFADIIAGLGWKDLLLTSIKIDNKWTKLIHYEERNRLLCKCNLCGVVPYGVKNIYAHLSGKKHKQKMNEVTELSNPKFTPQTIHLKDSLTNNTPNKETINNTKSVTKPNSTDNRGNNLIVLSDNNETNSDETTTAASVVQVESVDGSNKSSSSTNDDIIIVQEKSNAAATPLPSGKDEDVEEMEVPNPFSQTNGSGGEAAAGQYKIACVSLSKLIDCKSEEDENADDVIEISDNDNDDTPPNSLNQQEGGDKNNMNKKIESRVRVQEQQPQRPQPSSANIPIPTIQRPNKAIPTATARSTNIQRHLSSSLNKKELIFDSDKIDHKTNIMGFLGVEYVIKVVKKNDFSAPRYECSLCELILMGLEMQKHLLGYNHRLKYCQKHFPTAIRQYQQYMSDVPEHEIFKVMTPVLDKLAIAIEKHHGKFAPYKCYSSELESNRHDIFSKVYSRRHASEQHGPTFTHVLDAEEIRYLVQNRNNKQKSSGIVDPNQPASGFHDQNYYGYNQPYFQYDMPSYGGGPSYSRNEAPMLDNETHKMMVENFLKETSRIDPNEPESRRHNSKRMTPFRSSSLERKRLRSERKSVSPLRDGDIWQAYRHMVDIKVHDLEKKYLDYKKDPEQHPRYNEEWQKFWKRRKDELIRSGVDHRLYNYQNEWSIFFKSHMNELYKQNVEEIKIQCRERLYLPMTNNELSDPKYHVVVNIEDINDISSDDACEVENDEVQDKYNYNADVEDHLIRDNTNTEDQNESSPDLIHVLRILAALEEHLGSLGPKITDMLSKALLISKFSPSGIEDSFLTRANCIILETCVEKFKGFLYAGLTDNTKRRAINKAIDETNAFLKTVMPKLIEQEKNAMKLSELSRKLSDVQDSPTTTTATATATGLSPQKRSFAQKLEIEKATMPSNVSQLLSSINSNRQEKITSTTSSSSSSSLARNQQQSAGGNIRNDLTESEKSELASKLAASLIAKGKGDFNPEQIRKIIDIYFAIVNKKNNESGSSRSNAMDEINQNDLLNTIIQSFINQNPKSNQMTNTNQQQQLQQQQQQHQQQQQQHQQQQQYRGNINRNDNQRTSQMTNQNQQQQYFNTMNTNQNRTANTQQMSSSNSQQLMQQLQQFAKMNSNQQQQYPNQSNNIMPNNMNYQQQQQQQQQSNINMRSSVRGGSNVGPNLSSSSSATALSNLMNMRNINTMKNTSNEQQQQQQQSNINMRSSVRGNVGPNLSSSATATALSNLMNMRNINTLKNTSNEQNLRQNVPSFMNNMNNQYSSKNFGGNQGYSGNNRGGGGGGGGGGSAGGTGSFNQQLPSFLNNLNTATQNNNNSNSNNNNNNNWSRMMNSGNNQPINNTNQFRGRFPENNNNTERQPFWKRN